MSKEIFKANPNLDLYYKTSDGEPFFTPNAAENHAKGLKNKSVVPVYRSDFDESDDADENANADVSEIDVTAEILEQNETVVNTDPFKPESFPNRVLTFVPETPETPEEPETPETPEEPETPETPEEPETPETPAEPETPEVPAEPAQTETKTFQPKNQKK